MLPTGCVWEYWATTDLSHVLSLSLSLSLSMHSVDWTFLCHAVTCENDSASKNGPIKTERKNGPVKTLALYFRGECRAFSQQEQQHLTSTFLSVAQLTWFAFPFRVHLSWRMCKLYWVRSGVQSTDSESLVADVRRNHLHCHRVLRRS